MNGNVSLAKSRPLELLDSEISAVQSALHEHPKTASYREDIKPRQITVYECLEPDVDQLMPLVNQTLGTAEDKRELARRLQEYLLTSGQFTPVMRFILIDDEARHFVAQRMCYRGSVEDWMEVDSGKTIEELASRLIPVLGTQAFFELY